MASKETSGRQIHGQNSTNSWRTTATTNNIVLEAWGEGFVVGALLIMVCITMANMRHGVLLHKLILAELLLAIFHGTFCFMAFPGYGWYLSSTAALLYISSWVHNLVAWLKIRPFLRGTTSIFSTTTCTIITRIYLASLGLSIIPLTVQIVNNFQFFNNINDRYLTFRPYETLMRDPWWVFVCVLLLHVICKCYRVNALALIKASPRVFILLSAFTLAILFTVADIVASVHTRWVGATDGINPWWKLYLVMKCFTDTIMLDDFKTELDRISGRFGAHGTASRHASAFGSFHIPSNDLKNYDALGGDDVKLQIPDPSHPAVNGTRAQLWHIDDIA